MAVLIVSQGCQKETQPLTTDTEVEDTYTAPEQTVLGERLKNPYSLGVARQALDSLRATDELFARSAGTLKPTHLYVKFKPKDEEELSILRQDTAVAYFDVPMDYDIEYQGDSYRDPEVPDGQPTYLYTSLPVDYDFFPEVEHELLDELYMPDDEEDDDGTGDPEELRLPKKQREKLEYTSDLLTGHLSGGSLTGELRARRSKWRPSGRIRVADDGGGLVPIEGAQVKMRRLTKWKKTYTDNEGRFSSPNRFRYDVNYSVEWQRGRFTLRDNYLSEAKWNGPKSGSEWNAPIFAVNSSQWRYAHIFRASFRYCYQDILGIRRPPDNIKIRVTDNEDKDEALGSHSKRRRFVPGDSQIKIYNRPPDRRQASGYYATTIHELAHASHWNALRSSFVNHSTIVKETWARGVQVALTRIDYPGYFAAYTTNYTGFVVDLMDGPGTTVGDRSRRVREDVSGYSLLQIEDSLLDRGGPFGFGEGFFVTSLPVWGANLQINYSNSTERNIGPLADHWEAY